MTVTLTDSFELDVLAALDDADAVAIRRRGGRPRKPRLSWAPLGALLAGMELERQPIGSSARRIGLLLGEDDRAVARWQRDGITPDVADRLCHTIGHHPAELWECWGRWDQVASA